MDLGTLTDKVESWYKQAEPFKQRLQENWESLKEPVTYNTLLEHYRSAGLVGEERLAILQTLCSINKMCFGICSDSGSGKSYSLEKLVNILPENYVYRLELSSKTAPFYDPDINSARIIYVPELQKAMENNTTVELIKGLSENRDVYRNVTKGGVSQQQVIKKGKGVVFTLANENKFNYDAEIARRFLVFNTDTSEEQTSKIIREKAQQRGNNETAVNGFKLKYHLKKCIDSEFSYENPYLDYIAENIPNTLRARSYCDYLFSLFEASAKFNHPRRVKHKGKLFVDFEDVETVCDSYWGEFVKNLGEEGREIDLEECKWYGWNFIQENYPELSEFYERDYQVEIYRQ